MAGNPQEEGRQITVYACQEDPQPDWSEIMGKIDQALEDAGIRPDNISQFDGPTRSRFIGARCDGIVLNTRNSEEAEILRKLATYYNKFIVNKTPNGAPDHIKHIYMQGNFMTTLRNGNPQFYGQILERMPSSPFKLVSQAEQTALMAAVTATSRASSSAAMAIAGGSQSQQAHEESGEDLDKFFEQRQLVHMQRRAAAVANIDETIPLPVVLGGSSIDASATADSSQPRQVQGDDDDFDRFVRDRQLRRAAAEKPASSTDETRGLADPG